MDARDLPGVVLLLVFVIGGVSVWLRMQALRVRARALQQQLEQERQQRTAVQQQLRQTLGAIDEVTRQKVVTHITRSRPYANPPAGVLPTVQRMVQNPVSAADIYTFAVGWEETQGNPDVVTMSLRNNSPYRSGHMQVSGEPGAGKGTLVFAILAQLCIRTTTRQLQLFLIDPKRDCALWRGKAHNWRSPVLGNDPHALKAALTSLREEREGREKLREQYGVLEHEELPPEVRPPVLLVYLSELDGLKVALDGDEKALDVWMTTELGLARSSGIRYLVDVQNASGRTTSWRTHITTFLAGSQSSPDAIKPNIGLQAHEVVQRGGISPDNLPGPGYFTVRSGRDVVTVHVPLINLQHRREILDRLPDAPVQVEPLVEQSVRDNIPVPASIRKDRVVVLATEAEREQILIEARRLEAEGRTSGRNEVARRVFGRDDGDATRKVKQVCDDSGLLLPKSRGNEMLETEAVVKEVVASSA